MVMIRMKTKKSGTWTEGEVKQRHACRYVAFVAQADQDNRHR